MPKSQMDHALLGMTTVHSVFIVIKGIKQMEVVGVPVTEAIFLARS